jgi:hypothetical protein
MWIIFYLFPLHLTQYDDHQLAISIHLLPFLRTTNAHLLQLIEKDTAEVVKQLIFKTYLHEPLFVLQKSFELLLQPLYI